MSVDVESLLWLDWLKDEDNYCRNEHHESIHDADAIRYQRALSIAQRMESWGFLPAKKLLDLA